MAITQNKKVIENVQNVLYSTYNQQAIPNKVSDIINLSLDVTPNNYREAVARQASSITTGTISLSASVIWAGNTDREFYLTGALISFTKDVTCDIATGNLNVSYTSNGAGRQLASMAVLTLTAQNAHIPVSLTKPIKIDNNTAITYSGTYTAGSMARAMVIYGYFVEKNQ